MRAKCYHCGSDRIEHIRHLIGTGGFSEFKCVDCGSDIIDKNCNINCEDGCNGRYLSREYPVWMCCKTPECVICGADQELRSYQYERQRAAQVNP